MQQGGNIIAKNGIYAVVAKLYGMAVPIIVLPFVLRTLGVESYGKVSYVQSVVAYFILLSTLGIQNYAFRECSTIRDNKKQLAQKVSQIFTISVILTVISTVAFLFYILLVQDARDEYQLNLIYSLSIVGGSLMMDWLYNSLERFDLVSIRDIIAKTVYLVLCFIFIHRSEDYVIYAFFVVLSQPIIPMVINFISIRKGLFGFVPKLMFNNNLHDGFVAVLYLGLMTLGSKLFSSTDTILVKWLTCGNTDEAVGLYNSGILIPLVIEQLLFVVASVGSPRLFMYIAKGDEESAADITNKMSNIMYFLVVPAVLTCIFFPEEILTLLGGKEYLKAAHILQIYSLLLFLVVGITLAGTRTYIARKKEKKLFTILMCMALVNIILDYMFIGLWDIVGAAIATVVSNILLMTIELSLEKSWHFVFTRDKIVYLGGAILIAVIFMFSKEYLPVQNIQVLFISLPISALLYALYLRLVREDTIMMSLTVINNYLNNRKK